MCVPASLTWVGGVRKDGAEAERSPALPLDSSQPTWKEVLLHASSFQRHTQTGRPRPFQLFSFFKKIYLFFGCTGSSLLTRAFSSCCKWGLLSSCGVHTYCGGFSCCRAQALRTQAQWLWHTTLVTPQHMDSFWTRDRTQVPCIRRQILNHWTSSKVPTLSFLMVIKYI